MEENNNNDSNNNDNDSNNNDIKKLLIVETEKKTHTKKIKCEKEKKLRVETQTWGLNDEELSYQTQLVFLEDIINIHTNNDKNRNKYISKLTNHIKTKLSSYKHQDIIKKRFNSYEFVSFEETISLLKKCSLKCCYCSDEVYILYEIVREMKQWSLDRINNDIGHNSGNLVISCLECNLKRRRTNKDAFMFTKNMIIIKEGC
jgi:hypothetical protein